MLKFKFEKLYTGSEWLSPCYISCDSSGKIDYCSSKETADFKDATYINNTAVPGFTNAHSHAFQYAMAGLAEGLNLGHSEDDFWGWRENMYQLALNIDPDQMQAIATMLYKEMLRVGYTSVAEFHYLHHDKEGKPYQNNSEMGERLIAAAKDAGINITLVPVYYKSGDFGKPATTKQKRFISNSPENYLNLIEASNKSCNNYEGANVGVGLHSLRAAPFEDAKEILKQVDLNTPIHIHIAEQTKEIESCLQFCRLRPVEWLLENIKVKENYNLVHSTHINDKEVEGIAKSGATVVICPSTEGNLGDGIFPLQKYLNQNGSISIGSDSHISLSPMEELKFLDYVQRLVHQKRNIVCKNGGDESGSILFNEVRKGGYQSLLNGHGSSIKAGNVLNLTLIDSQHHSLINRADDKILSTLIFAADQSIISGTIVRGEITSFEDRSKITEQYKKALTSMK